MKKLLLVGVVGMAALLGGCGGSSDCDEEVLPPVTEAQFPRGQAPEYIIRSAEEVGARGAVGINGQVLGIEFESDNENNWKLIVQQFDADYSNGYLTKPTTNVFEYTNSKINASAGPSPVYLTTYDMHKVAGELLTVKQRGGFEDAFGNFYPEFTVYFPVVGKLEEDNGASYKINGVWYPKGTADSDVYVGRYVAGMYDGEKLNAYSMSFAGPAGGYTHTVTVDAIVDDLTFTYVDGDGNQMHVAIRPPISVERSDRILSTDALKAGMKVVVSAATLDYNEMVTSNANVYFVSYE